MRIAIVTDVHGNLPALEAVLADLKKTAPDLVLHGGDLAVNGCRPAEVIDLIRDLRWPGVVGNTDEALWLDREQELEARMPGKGDLRRRMFRSSAPWARERCGADRVEWLKTLPMSYVQDDVTLVHASPADLWDSPSRDAADDELARVYGPLNARLAVYAHIHVPFIRVLPGMIVANSGSVGMPFDGDRRASYLLTEGAWTAIRRVEYDTDREIRDLLASDFPQREWVAEVLRRGEFVPPSPVPAA
ncbi:MAG: metallophosphatase family protein [Bryobacteraceae bacterium]|nr:metallophosphatase family protein [Bryobacteraceae bacterium]